MTDTAKIPIKQKIFVIGTKVKCVDKASKEEYYGIVIKSPELVLAGQKVIQWDNGLICKYDEEFLQEHYEIMDL